MNFYKGVFGGEFETFSRFSEMPRQDSMPPLSEDELNRVMHVTLPISDATRIMASDTALGWGPPHAKGNNFSIAVAPDSKDEATRIFDGLGEGGKITMPLADTFWGSYFGMVQDRFEVAWMVDYAPTQEA